VTGGTTIESYNGDNTSYRSIGYYPPHLSPPAFVVYSGDYLWINQQK